MHLSGDDGDSGNVGAYLGGDIGERGHGRFLPGCPRLTVANGGVEPPAASRRHPYRPDRLAWRHPRWWADKLPGGSLNDQEVLARSPHTTHDDAVTVAFNGAATHVLGSCLGEFLIGEH